MLDFHTHILPGVDDGSRNVDESMQMLAKMKEQGVSQVVATPHFYADDESVERRIHRNDGCALYRALEAALLADGVEGYAVVVADNCAAPIDNLASAQCAWILLLQKVAVVAPREKADAHTLATIVEALAYLLLNHAAHRR